MCVLSVDLDFFYQSKETPDVLKGKPTGNCPWVILFLLAAYDELNLDVFLFPPTALVVVVFEQADKTLIS